MFPVPVAVLAGGLASRMHPRTISRPKALLDVAGRPFIDHQLALLSRQGISDVVLCIGHLGEQLQAHVGDGRAWSLRVQYSRDGDELLGTGGALKRASGLLGDFFFVMYGDSYLTCDFGAVMRTFDAAGRPGLMTVYENHGRFGPSNVLFEDGRIVRYDKRPGPERMRHIDYGLSILTRGALAPYPRDRRFDLTTVFQDLIAADGLAGHEVFERFYEIGSPEGLRDTEVRLEGEGRA